MVIVRTLRTYEDFKICKYLKLLNVIIFYGDLLKSKRTN